MFLSLLGLLTGTLKAQTTLDTIAWLIVENESLMPANRQGSLTRNPVADSILSANGIVRFEQAMPWAKSSLLRRVCEIQGYSDVTPAYAALRSSFGDEVYDLTKLVTADSTVSVYDPIDYWYWEATQNPGQGQWNLLKTQCNLAWDITKGDPSVILMVSDQKIDGSHPDIAPKLVLPYDPRTPIYTHDCVNASVHGTFVASCAAAETTENGGVANGFLAAASFKCQLIGYRGNVVDQAGFIQNCVHASTVMGARTITHCGGGGGLGCSLAGVSPTVVAAAIKEIHDNGTCIVYPAGNGTIGHHCGDANSGWLPFWPLHPSFDERIIIVSSTDKEDNHLWNNGTGVDYHSHFPEVDLCAPGYAVMGARETNCVEGNIYATSTGTSFASPNAASIAALVISINPCFGPEDVQQILKSTTDPITDAANYPGMVGTGRINAYQACLLAVDYGHYAPLTGSQTWSDNRFVKGDLILEPGALLIVTGTLRFADGAKLIVKQGARLIVDGGTLTKAQGCHDSLWAGIEAWGTSNQHQFPTNHPTYQGMVVLKNGAIVEHARWGFINWKPDDWNSLGGVIQVQGTLNDVGGTFRNCWRGAEFMEYHNFYPTSHVETNDNSYFRHAVFTVDDDYRGNDDFDSHARMWKVRGISFQQCDFINAQTSGGGGTVKPSHSLGMGIYSYDASYSVTSQCEVQLPFCEYGSGQPEPVCPEASLRPSRFIGLDHGIRAGSSVIGGYTFTVKDSYFENNVCGIFTDAVNNAAILRNTFVVGGREVILSGDDGHFQGKHRGIFNTQANAFRVEENRFSEPTTTYAQTEGVVVGYTGAYSNQVYKNTSTGMDNAFVAEGACVDLMHSTTTGLSFLCNQNVQNGEEDFKIRSWDQNPPPSHSIKVFQGSTSHSAGNTFTPQQNGSSPYYNFNNEPQRLPITYFWELPPGDLNTGAYNTPYVNRNDVISPHNSCPTRIICGGGIGPVKAALSPQIEQERLAYLNLKYVYESLLDGGDFDELKQTIMESWPSDAWQLRDELMDKSPYLSTDILKETRKKNILPDAMYLEVCVANPEATQREGFVKWVQYEAPNPLPEYIVAQVVASWDQKTWRTSLEADMGWHSGEYQRLNDELIAAMLTDSLAQPADSIQAQWQLNTSLRARFGEVNSLLGQNRFDAAVTLLEGLDANYVLEKQGKQDRDDLLDLIAVIRPVIEGSGRTLMQLEGGELDALVNIAERQPSLAASYARNTLCYGYDICIPPITGGTMQPKMKWVDLPGTETIPASTLTVHPNPASTWVAFSHSLTAKLDQARIRVLDALGRVMYETNINTSPGQEVWDTRATAAGTYTVELHNAGRLVDAQRVVVKP
ncbi:MAG: S8 family peptidase [Flavobacteriales bacterium]|nr:S8 family peptidase [Flavobacteriales bacterium]